MKPDTLEAECYVVGGCMETPDNLDEAREVLDSADFAIPQVRAIWDAMCALSDAGKPLDKAAVRAQLVSSGAQAVNEQWLSDVFGFVPERMGYHLGLVREASVRRRGAESCRTAAEILASGAGDATDVLDDHQQALFDLTTRRESADLVPAQACALESMKALQARYEHGGEIVGLATGLEDLDRLTCGFQPGDLVILAARPSMGKTALALNVVQHVGIELGQSAAMFSLEMPRRQLSDRVIVSESRCDGARYRTGKMLEADWSKLAHAAGRFGQAPIWIDDTGGLSLGHLRAKARRFASRQARAGKPLALVVIDYLQLMAHGESRGGMNRDQAIGATTRGLKALAKQLGCVVLALSQLNRDLEKRNDKRPLMSDLRESGNIEQDADVILFLYRDEVYHAETDAKGVAEVIVSKQRNGGTGTARVSWDAGTTTFHDLARGSRNWQDTSEAA